MFLKLILLLVYVVILFILARVIETLTWFEVGNISRRLLDPMTMSVIKIKALLDQRGINYEGAIEKQELVELVESSGMITEDASIDSDEENKQIAVTNFTRGSLFDEHVEDAKDSVWLVYIIPDRSHINYLADTSWSIIKLKMARFGVNFGVLDCNLDPLFCARRDWYSSCYILGLPEEFQTKSRVTLFKYTGPFRVNNIHSWIRNSISNKVNNIYDLDTFSNKWIQYTTYNDPSEVRVVMFSKKQSIPLFYSAVSVKFPGRVKFGFINTENQVGKDVFKKYPDVKPATYLIITKEYVFVYGENFGEDLTFLSMERYLKTLYPCMNDIFILSLVICNCLTLFELSLTHGTLLKRLMKFVWCIVKVNMFLLLIWITMLTLLQVPMMQNLVVLSLKLLRIFRLSLLGTYLYKDYCFYTQHIMFTEFLFVLFFILVGYIQQKNPGPTEEEENLESDEWNFAQFRTLEHLFSPTAGLFRTGIPAIDPERVYRRDIPTLSQVCNVPDNYIKNLPKWQFKIDRFGKAKDIETCGNTTDSSGNKLPCECDQGKLSGDLNDRASPCQACQKLQKKSDQGPHSSADLPKKSSQLEKIKHSDLILTDQSDTDQEKDTIDEDHLYLENSQCVICLDDYEKGVWLCGLPCGHSFHEKCIHVWLNRDNHYCPVCRWTTYLPKPTSIHLHSE